MRYHALRSHYLMRQGRYYCVMSSASAEGREGFPFKHKKVAQGVAKVIGAITRRPRWVYRYGSH